MFDTHSTAAPPSVIALGRSRRERDKRQRHDHHDHDGGSRQQSADPPPVEGDQPDAAGRLPFPQEQTCDQEAADHQEHVDAYEAAGDRECCVEQQHQHDRDAAEALDVGAKQGVPSRCPASPGLGSSGSPISLSVATAGPVCSSRVARGGNVRPATSSQVWDAPPRSRVTAAIHE